MRCNSRDDTPLIRHRHAHRATRGALSLRGTGAAICAVRRAVRRCARRGARDGIARIGCAQPFHRSRGASEAQPARDVQSPIKYARDKTRSRSIERAHVSDNLRLLRAECARARWRTGSTTGKQKSDAHAVRLFQMRYRFDSTCADLATREQTARRQEAHHTRNVSTATRRLLLLSSLRREPLMLICAPFIYYSAAAASGASAEPHHAAMRVRRHKRFRLPSGF